jgi:hypothetical protein
MNATSLAWRWKEDLGGGFLEDQIIAVATRSKFGSIHCVVSASHTPPTIVIASYLSNQLVDKHVKY